MKLLIGGKSRNIYKRKDGSAYYKSGGQQVDVTYMFKKNGGGLKKQYIKGGVGDGDSVDNSFDPNKANQQVVPETVVVAAPETVVVAAPETVVVAAPKKQQQPQPASAPLQGRRATGKEVAGLATMLAQQNPAEEAPPPPPPALPAPALPASATATATATATPPAEEAPAPALPASATATATAPATPAADAKTGSRTELEVLTDITALDKFPFNENKGTFWKAFFDLAQLVISVTNNLHKNIDAKIEIKTLNSTTAEKYVTKLNGIINFILESKITSDFRTREGIFSKNYDWLDYSKYQKEYLSLFTDKDSKFIIKKTSLLKLTVMSIIFDIIGGIAHYCGIATADKQFEKFEKLTTDICNNIHMFLKNESNFKQIKVSRQLDT
jgi:hypothetical protein